MAVLDLDRVLDRLPASVRAEVAWTRPVFRKLIDDLRVRPLSDDLIAECGRVFTKTLAAVGMVVVQHVSPSEMNAMFAEMAVTQRDELARTVAGDVDVLDTFDWCMSMLRSVLRTASAAYADIDARAPTRADLDAFAASPMNGLGIAQVLLAAAVGIPREASDSSMSTSDSTERVHELVDRAFVALTGALDEFARQGIWIDPVADDTAAQRGERVIRAANAIRGVLASAGDAFDAGRLTSLR